MRSLVTIGAMLLTWGSMACARADAACAIFGDSIGLGLGKAMEEKCATTAEVGILSSVVASRVTPGDRWTIVSLGSNDFPNGISLEMRRLSETRIKRSLAKVLAIAGRRLILILPSNDARAVVRDWAQSEGVATISFEAGSDGIHPRGGEYEAMAREVTKKISH